MIAFITTSSSVLLIESLYNSVSLSIRVLGFTFARFTLLFRKEKCIWEKIQLVQISSCLASYIHICVICTHIRIHVYLDLVPLDFSGPPGLSSRPLGSYQVPHVQWVCVYTYTHTYTHVAYQYVLLRSPVYTLPTLHVVFSRTYHFMTHCSNLTWWALLCRCDFLLVSRSEANDRLER